MKVIQSFPYSVRSVETLWIPMSDGCRLAARAWIPEGAENDPVPAVIDYNPYRRRDYTRSWDARSMAYIAGHGYACVRIDIRGSGDSQGILEDEYLKLEQEDGLEILRWLAAQPWCNGSVGIVGISWGGFNGLQIAARRPPELKAVISLCSTDDRYADDVHYMGGCLLGDNLSWASTMFGFNSLPPDPQVVGEKWRDMWMQRLESSDLWLEKWLRHQHRDAYWKHGSIREDYTAIRVPVLLASGWADGYSNSIFRMLENLEVPCKGLIGPWSHTYPHFGVPGPAIGFLQEMVRWWDHWLKGIDRGVEGDPALRVWMQDSVSPHPIYEHRPGRWVAEPEWPSSSIETLTYRLVSTRLVPSDEKVDGDPLVLRSPLSVGLFAGKWCSYSAPPDLPHDQREEDGGALIFESAPLEKPLEILGAPEVELELSADEPVAMVAVRLSDVRPNSEATRITYGLLNLTHRKSHEKPQDLVPHRRYRVTVRLNEVAQHFPEGHRIRISVSSSYFPLAWPSPTRTTLNLYPPGCLLTLPCRKQRAADETLRSFEAAEGAPASPVTVIETEDHRWLVKRDLARDISTLEVMIDDGVVRYEETGMEVGAATTERYGYSRAEYESVRGEVDTTWLLRREDWSIRTESRTVLTSTSKAFHVYASQDAYEGDRRVHSRNWDYVIPRKKV